MIQARTTTSCAACRRRASACNRGHSVRGTSTRRGLGPGPTPLQSMSSHFHFHATQKFGTNFRPAVLVHRRLGVIARALAALLLEDLELLEQRRLLPRDADAAIGEPEVVLASPAAELRDEQDRIRRL